MATDSSNTATETGLIVSAGASSTGDSTHHDTHGIGREALLVRAQRLGRFTVGWNVAEGFIAITAAIIAGSSALLGFGLDSFVESLSAGVLLWRLGAERRNPERADQVERIATKIIGASFIVLATIVAYEAIHTLASRTRPDTTPIGIALTAVSLVVMPILAHHKRQVAVALASKAAEADSAQTTACAYLSAIVLAGLALNTLLDWWWADPVAALVVVAFLLNEGRHALTTGQLDDCC